MNDFKDQAKSILKIEADAIHDLIDRIGDEFVNALDIMYECRGKVVVTGMGKSGIIGKKVAATMSSTGTPAFYLNPAEGGHGDVGVVSKDQVVKIKKILKSVDKELSTEGKKVLKKISK